MFNTKSPLERAMDAVLGQELRKLNNHLPKKRITLSELLKIDHPAVETVDGSAIVFNKSEIEELASVVPTEYHDRIRLPIIILRRMDLGKSVYTISGERVEEFTVKKMLGITLEDYNHMYRDRDTVLLYKPQIAELLRRFHSLIVLGFGIPRELADYAPSRD